MRTGFSLPERLKMPNARMIDAALARSA